MDTCFFVPISQVDSSFTFTCPSINIETQWTSFTSNLETLLKCSLVDKTASISQNTPKVNENSMVDSKLSSFYHIKPANKVWKSDWLVDPFKKLTETTISTKLEKKYKCYQVVGLSLPNETTGFDKLQWLWRQTTISTNTVWKGLI